MTVVYINAVQYQTCPNHESDNHFLAKIPGGSGPLVKPPAPPGSALEQICRGQIGLSRLADLSKKREECTVHVPYKIFNPLLNNP